MLEQQYCIYGRNYLILNYGSKESVRAQIGMVVPVDGAKVILNALLMTFAQKKYPFVGPTNGFMLTRLCS